MLENSDESSELNNPHDKFFKRAMSLGNITRPLLIEYLPTDLLAKLDLNTLEIDPNSYINDELKETFSDVVWSCRLKNSNKQRKIAFLFEHKSYKPAYPHFQLIDYQRNAWKMQIGAGQQPVPILPIIFYHGSQKWIVEPFDAYFGEVEAEMLQFMPCFNYILINLQDFSEEKIRAINNILLQKMLLGFKFYQDKNYLNDHIVELLFVGYSKLKNEQTYSFISFFSVYLTSISGISRKEVIQKAKQFINHSNSDDMDIFEEIKETFLVEGRAEGIEIGKKIAIYQVSLKGYSHDSLADIFDLPVNTIKQIIEEIKNERKE